MKNRFIWVGGDTLALYDFFGLPVDGALAVSFTTAQSSEFENHFNSLTPGNTPESPWMKKQWELLFACSWHQDGDESSGKTFGKNHDYAFDVTAKRSCYHYINVTYTKTRFTEWYSRAIDGVHTYAHALHEYYQQECPVAFTDKDVMHKCLDGHLFLQYLRNTSFNGVTGPISFDDKGDVIGGYSILQLRHNNAGETWNYLGGWDMVKGLDVNENNIDWTVYHDQTMDNSGMPDIKDSHEIDNSILEHAQISSAIPESVCSKPCKKGEAYIQQDLPCCWTCRRCRANEIVSANSTDCLECPPTLWPDENTYKECIKIDPKYLTWSDGLVLVLAILAVAGICVSIAVTVAFIYHRDTKLIKASSRELSAMILIRIFFAFISVYLFLLKPEDKACYSSHYGFTISIATIYAPLLAKTNRIYRIFAAGKKSKKRPNFISPRSQMLATLILISLQVSDLHTYSIAQGK